MKYRYLTDLLKSSNKVSVLLLSTSACKRVLNMSNKKYTYKSAEPLSIRGQNTKPLRSRLM